MNIKKSDLLKALEIVKPGLANKDIIEQATSFAFVNGNVVTYNDEISISHPVPGLNIEGAVKAELLYQLLNKVKSDEIEISITENEIQLKAGRAKAGLILESEITLPLATISEIGKWKLMPESLLRHLSFVMGSASRDMTQQILTCVHVHKEEEGSAWVEASDQHRITKCTFESLPINTFLIPASSVAKVVKLDPIKMAEGKGWIHFKSAEGTVISCRVFEKDAFPNTDRLFMIKGTKVTLPKNLSKVLDRASIFAKRDHISDEFVDITISGSKMLIKSEADAGWFKEPIKVEYSGPDLHFSISPYLLKDILTESLSCIISKDKMKFTGSDWEYVTGLKAVE